MAIGVDIDEVLVPTISYHCQFLNKKYNLNLRENDFHCYRFWEIYNVSRNQAVKDFLEFAETEDYRGMLPMPGAIWGIKHLQKLRELYAITSRQKVLVGPTKDLINAYFPKSFTDIVFGNMFSLEGEQIGKLELCKRKGIEVLIEDDPTQASEVSREIPVILFDKPWNQDTKGKNIHRAYNWKQIVGKARNLLNLSFLS